MNNMYVQYKSASLWADKYVTPFSVLYLVNLSGYNFSQYIFYKMWSQWTQQGV